MGRFPAGRRTAAVADDAAGTDPKEDEGKAESKRRKKEAAGEKDADALRVACPADNDTTDGGTAENNKEHWGADAVAKGDAAAMQSGHAQQDDFGDDEAEWQIEMMAEQGNLWEGGPQEIEEKLSQIEAEAHAVEEKEREAEAARERRPQWIEEPSSHKPEKGKNIRMRILKERRRVASRYGDGDTRGSSSYSAVPFL